MFVFSRFLARATSWSVTLVHIRILENTNKCISPCSPKILIQITRTDLLILFLNNKSWNSMKGQSLCWSSYLLLLFHFFPLSEKIGDVHSWEESLEKPHLSIIPTSLLRPPPHPLKWAWNVSAPRALHREFTVNWTRHKARCSTLTILSGCSILCCQWTFYQTQSKFP